ncbi:MAG: DarT ssDNA thymidine ADP-ribosyltransferase family protein [Cryobacterium sp.]
MLKTPRASRAKAPSLLAPRTTAAAPRTKAAAQASVPRTTAAARSSSARIAADNVAEQRIYHVTHIRNLAGILAAGALLADTNDALQPRPAIDISATNTRDARRSMLVDGDGSASVAGYVPFFLSPNATFWNNLRSGSDDPRLELDALGSAAGDFVIFVSTVGTVLTARAASDDPLPASVTLADGDAAAARTRFAATPDAADRMLRLLRANPDAEALQNAELLVADTFPLHQITLVGVTNDRVRDAVKAIFQGFAFRPRVVVYPPWFLAAEDAG